MPFVKFTENVTVNDRHKGTIHEVRFEANKVYELPFESCMRWKKRGKAVDVTAAEFTDLMAKTDRKIPRPTKTVPSAEQKSKDEEIRQAAKAGAEQGAKAAETVIKKMTIESASVKPVSHGISIPDDWRALAWPKMKVLASYFTTEGVHNRPEAIKIIETELARRAG